MKIHSPLPSCDDTCPVRKTAEVIDRKWVTLIVRDLLDGKKRYSELQRSLVGISPKVLAERLHFLAERGILTKTIYPTVPLTTEYELTELGRQLQGVIQAMAEFGHALVADTAG